MNRQVSLVAALVLPAAAAWGAAGDPCTASFDAHCEGTVLVFCGVTDDGTEVFEAECAPPPASLGACKEFDDGSVSCAVVDGDRCLETTPDDSLFVIPCANDSSGCVNGVCVANVGACTPGSPLRCLPTGELAQCMSFGQTVAITCALLADANGLDTNGGFLTCSGEGICTGVQPGGDCAAGIFECTTGECTDETATAPGTCRSPGDEACAGIINFEAHCDGDVVVECGEEVVLEQYDCAAQDLVCFNSDGIVNCGDRRCGETAVGTCDDGTAVSCEMDFVRPTVTDEIDCLTTGQTCLQERLEETPRCVVADPECGPSALGTCAGNLATICADGLVVTTSECSNVGRVCGPTNAAGSIGCIEPIADGGGGEEAAGPECEEDRDCDDDEVCDDGDCEREDRDGSGDTNPLSCTTAGLVTPSLLTALGLLLCRRRRFPGRPTAVSR